MGLPLIYIIYLSFMTRGDVFGVKHIFTLSSYADLASPFYIGVFWNSLKLAAMSELVIICVGYPFGYIMAKQSARMKKLMLILIMLPYWTSGLIRLYGWVIAFRANGTLDKLLMALGITDTPLKLLYLHPAVVVGMAYALLPTMILAVFSATEKMDWSLVDAAKDLGASKLRAFWDITLKNTISGLLSGVVLTFIPSMGLYFVVEILGGNRDVIVGSVLQDLMTRGNNQPLAAAMAVWLMLMTAFMLLLYRRVAKTSKLEGIY